jgi:hypothetical protein
MEKYKCEICGKNHSVYRSIESPIPELISEIPENEHEERIVEFKGLYVVDRKWILGNGYILIEMESLDEPIYYWQVWVSMSLIDFKNNLEKLTREEPIEVKGKLESHTPFYKKSKDLNVNVIIHVTDELELELEIRVVEESKIKTDQSKPISRERAIEIMQHIHHPELHKPPKVFDKSFHERLNKELDNVKLNYVEKNENFVVSLNAPDCTLFQIIHSNMLESNNNKDFGYGLHLSFDDSFEDSKDEIRRFKKQDYASDFNYHNLDEIPTYQINLQENKARLIELVETIVGEVYQRDIETIDLDAFEV